MSVEALQTIHDFIGRYPTPEGDCYWLERNSPRYKGIILTDRNNVAHEAECSVTSPSIRIPRFWFQNRGNFYFFSAFRPASIRSRPSFRISKEVARHSRT